MNVKIFVLLCSSFVLLVKCIADHRIDMITSFVILDDRPTSLLVPYLCWNQHALKSLVRSISRVGSTTATSLQYNRTEYDLQYILILADLACPGTETFLIRASHEGYFKAPYRWLLLNHEDNSAAVNGVDALVDSDLVLVKKISEEEYLFIEGGLPRRRGKEML